MVIQAAFQFEGRHHAPDLLRGGLAGLAFAEPLYQVIVRALPAADNILWRLGVNFERYLLIAAAFSLFFLARSIFRKEPQVQFVIEIILAALLYSLL